MAEETNFSQGEAEEVKYQERKRLLFFGLPWTFTKYTISQDMITVDEGLIKVELIGAFGALSEVLPRPNLIYFI